MLDFIIGEALPWIVGALGVGFAFFTGRRGAKKEIENKGLKSRIESMEKSRERETNVESMDDDELLAALSKRVSKNKRGD